MEAWKHVDIEAWRHGAHGGMEVWRHSGPASFISMEQTQWPLRVHTGASHESVVTLSWWCPGILPFSCYPA